MHLTEVRDPIGKIVGAGNSVIGLIRCDNDSLVIASPELGETDEDFRKFVGRMASRSTRVKHRRIKG